MVFWCLWPSCGPFTVLNTKKMEYSFISDSQVNIKRSILSYLSKYNLYCFNGFINYVCGLKYDLLYILK